MDHRKINFQSIRLKDYGWSVGKHRPRWGRVDALTLIVMTRLPCEGRNKTRLIPALGAKGAMDFHDRLARHAIGRASSFCMMEQGRKLVVCLEGGTPVEGKSWLGEDGVDCRLQADGDLGERMKIASAQAFAEGAQKVIIIGTDCPDLHESILHEATYLLGRNDLVFGPALDGGYYLIGMARPVPAVFEGIAWGGTDVLAHSLQAAAKGCFRVAQLPALPDVDFPEDLAGAEIALAGGSAVSVIIPAANDASSVRETLAVVFRSSPHEVIVVDAGRADDTRMIAKSAGARVISSPEDHAQRMNRGAAAATGEFLLFLHATTHPPEGFPEIIASILNRPHVAAGEFRSIGRGDLEAWPLPTVANGLRCRPFAIPRGDQCIFTRRSLFAHTGGFPVKA